MAEGEDYQGRRAIKTKLAPAPGNYNQGIVVDIGSHLVVYTAGQTGNDPVSGDLVSGGIGPQTAQALNNLKGVLRTVGGRLEDIVNVTVFMKNMGEDKQGFEGVYSKYIPQPLPARSLVEVKDIPLPGEGCLVEINAVAYVPKNRY